MIELKEKFFVHFVWSQNGWKFVEIPTPLSDLNKSEYSSGHGDL